MSTAGIPTAPPSTGMISPGAPFVAPDYTPTPLSFRFLFELWKLIGEINDTNTTLNNAIITINTNITNLQNEINTINSRLAAAGIP